MICSFTHLNSGSVLKILQMTVFIILHQNPALFPVPSPWRELVQSNLWSSSLCRTPPIFFQCWKANDGGNGAKVEKAAFCRSVSCIPSLLPYKTRQILRFGTAGPFGWASHVLGVQCSSSVAKFRGTLSSYSCSRSQLELWFECRKCWDDAGYSMRRPKGKNPKQTDFRCLGLMLAALCLRPAAVKWG